MTTVPMTATGGFEVKGWCPGAHRPMESGDGLIVRVRPRAGRLEVEALSALAAAARRYGNGHIDLTRRANLQIRGVVPATLGPLLAEIRRLGLLDADAGSEAIRNIVVSPLAGIDPAAADVRPIAAAVEAILAQTTALHALPAKFGFVVDGGGALPVDEVAGDIRLRALAADGDLIEAGLARTGGTEWLGACRSADAAEVAVAAAAAVLKLSECDAPARARLLSERARRAVAGAVAGRLAVTRAGDGDAACLSPGRATARLGVITLAGGRTAVGIGAPFGRIEAEALATLSAALAGLGVREASVAPWRAIYAGVGDAKTGGALIETAVAAGLVVASDDPVTRVDACPGKPACRAATTDARGDARHLAVAARAMGFRGTLHVSGCAKGCARPEAADLVLAGDIDGRYRVIRGGTARDPSAEIVASAEIVERAAVLLAATRSPAHV